MLENIPQMNFIDNKEIEDVRGALIADYEAFMTQASGKTVSLARASPLRMVLNAAAVQIYQAMQYIDRAGKQSMLKYSYGEFLDNLGALKGVTRLGAQSAVTTLRFTLSAARSSVTAIPAGTRVATTGGIRFRTLSYGEIAAGELSVELSAQCTVTGTEGNGLAVGELSTQVDPVAYVAAVTNITESSGGADIESDTDFAERIYLAPSAYSVAGPEAAYIYLAKAYSSLVGDVKAVSEERSGQVDIIFLLSDGSAPGEEMLSGMLAYFKSSNIRPMTDYVTVSAPEEIPYAISFTYYINRSDSAQALMIQSAVEAAVQEYITWQRKIGRDLNPDELRTLVKQAGAKRLEIVQPEYQAISALQVAALTGEAICTYGGLEDD